MEEMDMNLGAILGENMGQSSVPRSHRDSRFDIWSGEKLQAATPEEAYTRAPAMVTCLVASTANSTSPSSCMTS